jgi:uncharacterized membrane protein YkoI
MKPSLITISALSLIISASASASSIGDLALSYVPGGHIIQERNDEVKLRTDNGSVIEVEFTARGEFEEASGKNVDADKFNPPHSLLTLEKATAALKKAGKTPVGDWSLENSFIKGWHYDFDGFEAGREMEYEVDAKTGALRTVQFDD